MSLLVDNAPRYWDATWLNIGNIALDLECQGKSSVIIL